MIHRHPGNPPLRRFLTILTLGLLALPSLWAGGAAEKPAAPATKVVYQQTFENDDGGFTGRGASDKVILTGLAGHSGKAALTITKRTATWNGPMRDMSSVFKLGRTYLIQFWARYDVGPDTMGLNVSFAKSAEGAGDTYETIGGGVMVRGDWVKFEVEYTVPKDASVFSRKLYMETPYKADNALGPGDLVDFAIDDLVITRLPDAPPQKVRTDIPAFQSLFPEGMKIGTAITSDHFSTKNIHHDLLRHFNTLVYGNETKMDAMQPQEKAFRWDKADALVKYGQENHLNLRFHTLGWHSQVAPWFFQSPANPDKPATKDQLLARLKTHIQTIVGRYKGKFYTYDVFNEVIGENGNLRDSPWSKIVGSDEFVEMAFRWAHEADPDAVLVLNDYNVEYPGPKQDGFYREVKSLLERGVPIGAVGLQCHFSVGYPTVADVRDTIRKFAALGLDVQVTELDLSIYANGNEAKKKPTRETLLDQAKKYADFFAMFKEEYLAKRLSTVLVWGMSDDETWLDNFPVAGRTDHPLLFGKDLGPKPAYWALVDPSKMPVAIQRADAYKADAAPATADDPAWGLVSARTVKAKDGTVKGWFKTLWTPEGLTLLARVNGAPGTGDAVRVWLDPKNAKSIPLPADAAVFTFPRSKALASDDAGYTLLATVPFGAKTGLSVGFDLAVADASGLTAWNDGTLSHDKGSDNWATVTMKVLPRMVDVTPGTPKVDGTVDPLWANAVTLPLDVASLGDAEAGSTVKLLWDDKFLYALYEIKDRVLNDKAKNAYEQDSVELFLDQNNSKSTAYQADDGQYRVSFRNLATFNGGQVEGFASASRLFAGGFRVEMQVPLYAVTGAPGVLLGFDAQQNNADGNAARVGIRNWADGSNAGYQNTSGWGILRLVP